MAFIKTESLFHDTYFISEAEVWETVDDMGGSYLYVAAELAEWEVIMETKGLFQKILKFMGLFCLFLCVLMLGGTKAHAESGFLYPEDIPFRDITSNQIGTVYSTEENAPSVSGIRITKNEDRMLMYSFDVWSFSKTKGWIFQYENLQGKYKATQDKLKLSDDHIVELLQGNDWRGRYLVHGKNAYEYVKNDPCFAIETKRYQKGQLLSTEYEYSTDPHSKWLDSRYSLMNAISNKSDYIVGMGTPDQISHKYVVMSGIFIGDGGDVTLEADDAEVVGKGEAYYGADNKYIVRKMPVAVKKRDTNVYYFEGWYTAKDGGTKISEGDQVEKGMVLYPHWKAVEQKCNVTCIDILKTPQGEEKLGQSKWQADYGETVKGSAAGCASGAGVYYPGREYVDCSETVISELENTVYRYFKNSLVDVACIDMVHVGPDTGQQLGNHIWKSEYSTTTSGSVIGCDRRNGAYYEGYRYMYCSMKQVGEDGCTVYRYFSPIIYNIEFIANCESAGEMSSLRNLYYGHDYQLTKNTFINRKTITLNPNGQNAVCDTSNQVVYSDFLGWSSVASGGGVQYSDGCSVNGITKEEQTVSLYAVWSDKEVTLTAQPVRLGYEFAGWSEDPLAETGQKQFKANRNMNLYASWKAIPTVYHVEYYKQKLDKGYELASRYDFLGTTDTEVSAGDVKNLFPGFILDEESSHLTGIVKADGSLILNAYFRREKYAVSFDANGGRLMSDEKDMETIRGAFEEIVTLPEAKLQRTGYDFGGWTTKPDGDQVVAKPGEDYRLPNHDQTLYAYWIPRDDIPYKLIPFYENINGIGYTRGEAVELKGTTALTVKQDLVKQYETEECGEIIRKIFGEGYRLLEENVLDNTIISGYGNTCVEIYLRRDACDFTFIIKTEQETRIISKEKVLFGQKYTMPKEIKDITNITGYSDETGKIYKPGDMIEVTESHRFMIYQKGTDGTDTPSAGESPAPSGNGTGNPSVGRTPAPAGDATGSPSAGGTAKPAGGGTGGPAGTKTPATRTPVPSPKVTESPRTTEIPAPVSTASDAPRKTQQPSQSSQDGMNVISTWAGADRDAIASKLASNAREAFLKKGQKVKKKGIIYRVTKTGVKNRTLRVEGLSKEKKTIKIPAQVQLRGYAYQVTQIKKGAFANRKMLQKVIVGKNIKKIGKKAFSNSRKLRQITFQTSSISSIRSGAWTGCSRDLKLKFSKSCGAFSRRYILKKNAAMR